MPWWNEGTRRIPVDAKVAEYLHISEAFEHAAEFDLIHSHYDFMALATPAWLKRRSSRPSTDSRRPESCQSIEKYRDGYYVSISNSDRAPGLNYLATVYNGIDLSLYPFSTVAGIT